MTTTATHAGEPFAESFNEAVQTSVMAVRLIMTIADAVRRSREKQHTGKETELPPADKAVEQAGPKLKDLLPDDIATVLMSQADWPQIAQQLMAIQQAGVDLGQFLPRVGDIAATVHDAVAANAERIAHEGTDEWASLLRTTMPAGSVREAILSSPAWPDIAQQMKQVQERGVDVRQVLVAAHAEGIGVDRALARVTEAGADLHVPLSKDALRTYGPITVGLDIPKDLDLSSRGKALAQLGVSPTENEHFVRLVRAAMPHDEGYADQLVASRQWPLLAARMAQLEDAHENVAERLGQVARHRTWEAGPPEDRLPRLVEAANDALRKPLWAGGGTRRMPVLTEAAKAQSVTAPGPTDARAKPVTPAEPAVAAHRAPAAAPQAGRTR
ncbi:hypothetical protein ACFYWP_37075 [Actinacidiphila glaucinigra]|uniref:hypothetical protein n=1 Tax=Actinacidiphila glaucinigra TaxID=235986 RepID=UPI0036945CA5